MRKNEITKTSLIINKEAKLFANAANKIGAFGVAYDGMSFEAVTSAIRIMMRVEEGEQIAPITLPMSALSYLSAFPDGSKAIITVADNKVVIAVGRSKTTLTSLGVATVPPQPKAGSLSVELSTEMLEKIKKVATAAVTKATKPVSTTLFIAESNGRMIAHAIDGYHLAVADVGNTPAGFDVRIPKQEFLTVYPFIKGGCTCVVSDDNRKAIFESGAFKASINMMDCNPIDFKSVMSQAKQNSLEFTVNPGELEESIKRLARFAPSNHAPILHLKIEEDALTAVAPFPNYYGEEEVTIKPVGRGDAEERKTTIGVNANYLLDALSVMEGVVTIHYRTPVTPIYMTDGNIEYIVVPCRILA